MPIKYTQGDKIVTEAFAGEIPLGTPPLSEAQQWLHQVDPDDTREPYFVGDFTEDEKNEWRDTADRVRKGSTRER